MRKVWQDKIDEINALLSEWEPCGRVKKDDETSIADLREAMHVLTCHVENLSKLLDKVGHQR